MAKSMTKVLVFQVFRTENTAYQSEFHVLGLICYVLGLKFLLNHPRMFWCFWVYGIPQTLIYSLHNVGHFHQWSLTFTTVLPLEISTTYWDQDLGHNFILKADDLFTHGNIHKLHAVSIGSLCRCEVIIIAASLYMSNNIAVYMYHECTAGLNLKQKV